MKSRPGFTIVELLVTMTVIAVLTSLALPAASNAVAASRSARCAANLRSLGQALELYRSYNKDLLPHAPAVISVSTGRTAFLDAIKNSLDAPIPALRPDGTCSTSDPFRCPTDRVCAPAHGVSYFYNAGELMEALTIDGSPDPARVAARMIESDLDIPVLSDMGDRELMALGDTTPWHRVTAGKWRNALFGDGRVRKFLAPGMQ